jgi:hypothetical protein
MSLDDNLNRRQLKRAGPPLIGGKSEYDPNQNAYPKGFKNHCINQVHLLSDRIAL